MFTSSNKYNMKSIFIPCMKRIIPVNIVFYDKIANLQLFSEIVLNWESFSQKSDQIFYGMDDVRTNNPC